MAVEVAVVPDGVDCAAVIAKLDNRSGGDLSFFLVSGATPTYEDEVRQAGALILVAYFRDRGEVAGEKAAAEEKKRKSRVEGDMRALRSLRFLFLCRLGGWTVTVVHLSTDTVGRPVC
jgi:hypothetical protein